MNRRLALAALTASVLGAAPAAQAQRRQGRGFSTASLNGSYGVQESGDGSVATGLGIVEYDGTGGAVRRVKVNAPDGSGGRRLIEFESTGTYTVEADGTGTVVFTNTAPNPGAVDTFDFVVTGSQALWVPGRGQMRVATEIYAAQREAGVTVSLVTSIQKRIADAAE